MAYQDLAERLENFAAAIIKLYSKMPTSYAGQYLAQQLPILWSAPQTEQRHKNRRELDSRRSDHRCPG